MKNDNYIGFVYIWINKINGKKYIGLHVGEINDGYTGSGKYFKRAMKKYGIENFERKILYYEYNSIKNLYQKEFDIINEMNAVFSSEYYNLSNFDPKNCSSLEGKKHRVMSDTTKKKLSLIRTGFKHSEETKIKMSKQKKGQTSPTKGMKGLTSGTKNGNYGKKWYHDPKNRISKLFFEGEEPDKWIKGMSVNRSHEKIPFMVKNILKKHLKK